MDEDERRILSNSYFLSQCNYCPLIWMNHNKSINKNINVLHERALRLIIFDHLSNFKELIERDNSVSIHQIDIQALAIIMHKVVNNVAPTILSELFFFTNVSYDLRRSHFIPKIRNIVPEEMKQKSSLLAFKREIKQWVPNNCPCRICKNYLTNIGLI